MLVQSAAETRAMVQALATHELTIGGASVPVIFEAPAGNAFGAVDMASPSVTLAQADWPGVSRGDALPAIDGVTYSVIGVEPTGDGLLTLRVSR